MDQLLSLYNQVSPIEQARFLALLLTNPSIVAGADTVIAFSERTGVAIDDTQGFYAAIAAAGSPV